MSDTPVQVEIKAEESNPSVVASAAAVDSVPPALTLASPWTFWYTQPPSAGVAFHDRLHKLGSFSTIDEFYPLYAHTKRPAQLADKATISIFRGDTEPLWENFRKGGRWMILLHKPAAEDGKLWLNRLWEQVVMHLICEGFRSYHVVGADVEIRPSPPAVSFAIWLDTVNSVERANASDHLRKQVFHVGPNVPIEWKGNKASLADDSGHAFSKVYKTVMSPTTTAGPMRMPSPSPSRKTLGSEVAAEASAPATA